MYVCKHNGVWVISDSHTILQSKEDEVYIVDVNAKFLNWRISNGKMVTDIGEYELQPVDKVFIEASKTTVAVGETLDIKVSRPTRLVIEGKNTATTIDIDNTKTIRFSKSDVFKIYAQDIPSNIVKIVVSEGIIEEV